MRAGREAPGSPAELLQALPRLRLALEPFLEDGSCALRSAVAYELLSPSNVEARCPCTDSLCVQVVKVLARRSDELCLHKRKREKPRALPKTSKEAAGKEKRSIDFSVAIIGRHCILKIKPAGR